MMAWMMMMMTQVLPQLGFEARPRLLLMLLFAELRQESMIQAPVLS